MAALASSDSASLSDLGAAIVYLIPLRPIFAARLCSAGLGVLLSRSFCPLKGVLGKCWEASWKVLCGFLRPVLRPVGDFAGSGAK